MEEKTKLDALKLVTKFVVGRSAGMVIGSVIKNNATPSSPIQEIQMVVGGLVIGSMVADKAVDHVHDKIDEARAAWKEFNAKKDELETK